jgi:nucleotide-binding universal stress UspA family protein
MTQLTETPVSPATSARTGGRIVVGVDGSDSSLEALRRAVRIAAALDLTVEAVTSWRHPADYAEMTGDFPYSPVADAQAIGEETAEKIWSDKTPDWFSVVTVEGYPAEALIEQSRGAEMLVVGSRGHGGLAGVLLGSVSAKCAEHASCPVLIIH